jgi:hypothetical protein
MITTIENGINFQNKNRYFTKTEFTTNLGYEIHNYFQVGIEVDNEVILLQTDLLVDGVSYPVMASFIAALGL